MATKLPLISGSPRFILVVVTGIAIATGLLGWHNDLDRNLWPAWVQAVGSVLAILVAVWVSWQQAESRLERERASAEEEVAGLLRAIRTEVEFTAKQAQDVLGEDMQMLAPGEPYLCAFPIQEDPFDIYNSALPRFGLIHDNALLAQIVRTYAKSKGFVLTLRYHGELLAVFERARAQNELHPNQATLAQLDRSIRELTDYSGVLRDHYLGMKEDTDKLIPLLQRY